MGFRTGQHHLLAARRPQHVEYAGLSSAGEVDFLKNPGVDRSSPNARNAMAQPLDVMLGNKGRNTELARAFKELDAVAGNLVGFENRRGEFFLNIDDKQERVFAGNEHQRNTTVLFPCTSTRSSRW